MEKQTSEMNLKKTIYIFLVMVLWTLIAFIAYGLLTLGSMAVQSCIVFLKENVQFYGLIYSPIPEVFLWVFMLIGAYAGYLFGLRWWNWVYVEKKHWRTKHNK